MKKVIVVIVLTILTSSARAGELRTFFTSCAWGTGIGALVGLTALAFSESPNSNLSMVSRGASIGLYSGMAIGYYMITKPESEFRGDIRPVTQHQPNETETLINAEPMLPSMPLLAVTTQGPAHLSPGVVIGYRFNIP